MIDQDLNGRGFDSGGISWGDAIEAIGRLLHAIADESSVRGSSELRRTQADAQAAAVLCRRTLDSPEALMMPEFSMAVSAVLAQLLLSFPLGALQERVEEIIRILPTWVSAKRQRDTTNLTAIMHSLLGCAYRNRTSGARLANLTNAIYHFELALERCNFDESPTLLASIHHNLGALYTQRLGDIGRRATALAIEHCSAALALFGRDTDPFRWAVMQSDLGLAYIGGTAEQAELAIDHLQQALSVFTSAENPFFWAECHHRLGLALMYRLGAEDSRNAHGATHHFERALDVFSSGPWDKERAATLLDLGRLYFRTRRVDSKNTSRAVAALEAAVKAAARADDRHLRASIHYALARAYFHQKGDERQYDLIRAIVHFRTALDTLDPKRRPAATAIATRELADAEAQLSEIRKSDGCDGTQSNYLSG